MTTYPPTPGPPEPEPEPTEPQRRDETGDGATPFSGNEPGPAPNPEPGWTPPGAGGPRPTHGETPGESPRAPGEEPHGATPPTPPPPGTGPGAPPPAGGGYSPYAGGTIPPAPPPPAHHTGGHLQQPRNGMGKAALICGIIAIVMSFIPGVNWFTWPLGVLAIVFGAIGWSRANKGQATNKSMAITGLVLGIASFFTFCLIYIIIGAGSGVYYDSMPMP